MTEVKPLKLFDVGGGGGEIREFAPDDTLSPQIVGLGNVDNTSDMDKPVSIAQQSVLDAKPGRNLLINSNPLINQRSVSGTVVLAAGAYGHDRWKAGTAGCTYTFTNVGGEVIFTISSGSLVQVIEGINLISGTHVLSWSGTAQGKIGAGPYSESGVTASITGGGNLSVEFGVGTLGMVQFERSLFANRFDQRIYGQELLLCQRYYETLSGRIVGPRDSGGGFVTWQYKADKRAIPSIVLGSGSTVSVGTATTSNCEFSAVSIYPIVNPGTSASAEL